MRLTIFLFFCGLSSSAFLFLVGEVASVATLPPLMLGTAGGDSVEC